MIRGVVILSFRGGRLRGVSQDDAWVKMTLRKCSQRVGGALLVGYSSLWRMGAEPSACEACPNGPDDHDRLAVVGSLEARPSLGTLLGTTALLPGPIDVSAWREGPGWGWMWDRLVWDAV